MKTGKIAYILPAIFFVIMIAFILFQNLFRPSYGCTQAKEFKEANYRGIVFNKFLDKENHSSKTLLIKYNDVVIDMNLDSDNSGYFEYANIGDTIIKIKDHTNLQVIRKDSTKAFNVDFACK